MQLLPLIMENFKATVAYAERHGLRWFIDNFGQFDVSKTRKHIFPLLLMIKNNNYSFHMLSNNKFSESFYWYCQNEGTKFKNDTYKFKTLEDFLNFCATERYRVSKAEQKRVAKSEMETIFENDKALVIRIKGKMASCIYGYGTKWCITQKNESYYESYVTKGYIFYFVFSKILPATDDMYKAAFAVDVERHLHVFNSPDNEISNIKGDIDNHLDKHNIPYDIFKYIKTSYVDRLKLAGIIEMTDNSIVVIKPQSVDWKRLDVAGRKIIYKNCDFQIDGSSELEKMKSFEFQNCDFYISNVKFELLPKNILSSIKNSKTVVLQHCTNVILENINMKSLTVSSCRSLQLKNITVDSFISEEKSEGTIENMTVLHTFSNYNTTNIIFKNLKLHGIKTLSIPGNMVIDEEMEIKTPQLEILEFKEHTKVPTQILDSLGDMSITIMRFKNCTFETEITMNPKLKIKTMDVRRGVWTDVKELPQIESLEFSETYFNSLEWLKTIKNIKEVYLTETSHKIAPPFIVRKDMKIDYGSISYSGVYIEDGMAIDRVDRLTLRCYPDIDLFGQLNQIKEIGKLRLYFDNNGDFRAYSSLKNKITDLTIHDLTDDVPEHLFDGAKIEKCTMRHSHKLPNFKKAQLGTLELSESNLLTVTLSEHIDKVDFINVHYTTLKAFGHFESKGGSIYACKLMEPLTYQNAFYCTDIDALEIDRIAIKGTYWDESRIRDIISSYSSQVENGESSDKPLNIASDEVERDSSVIDVDMNDDGEEMKDEYDPYNDPARLRMPNGQFRR